MTHSFRSSIYPDLLEEINQASEVNIDLNVLKT